MLEPENNSVAGLCCGDPDTVGLQFSFESQDQQNGPNTDPAVLQKSFAIII